MSISEPQFDEFERTVEHEFNFLQNYGFKKACLQKIDFEYPQDKRVEVNYFSETVCVTIRWFLIYANLEVGLIELIDTKLPEKIFLRSIPFGIQENRAEFERGVVGDSELPVSRKAVGPGVFKIAGGDGEKFGDL